MKKPLTFILLFLLPVLAGAGSRTDSILRVLDQELADRPLYAEKKEMRQNILRQQIAETKDGQTRFDLCTKLYKGYIYYQNDSAHKYAMESLRIAEELGNKTLRVTAECNLLNSYILAGLYHESVEFMNSIDIEGEDPALKATFYHLGMNLYSNLASYNHGTPFHLRSLEKMTWYRDFALICLKEVSEKEYERLLLNKLIWESERDSVIAYMHGTLERFEYTHHQQAMIFCSLAGLYYGRGEPEKGIYYYALAAIHDIRDCIRETVVLRELARALTREGEVMAGSRYMQTALEDANFYNTRHRKREVNAVLPDVEREKLRVIEEQKDMLRLYLISVSVLLAALLIAFYIIYRQIRKINQAKRSIERQYEEISVINRELEKARCRQQEANNRLEKTNNELQESNEIKDQYIIQSLYGKSEYMDRFEELLRKVDRKVKARQYEDLRTLHKDFNMKMERGNMFSDFDRTFLLLFPDFITEYNKLFLPEDHVTPDENGNLSPELCIFALIRLGITENERISRFLKLSVNTIYAYKAKAKNKSVVPNEEFEYRIMRIRKQPGFIADPEL
ncbi:MAG: DUF6377 domain-containing protein [Bacteroides sp.]|nr:DUF6377 domain-containing protein [Bacteroides sp.]